MKVVLTKRVPKLGEEHDLVNVKTGYARNFLLPQGIAVLATASAIKRGEVLKAERSAKAEAKQEGAQNIGDKVKGLVLIIKKKARSEDPDATLYGSVTEKMIVDALSKDHGIQVNRDSVKITDPIKKLGEHKVLLHLSGDTDVKLKIKVEPET